MFFVTPTIPVATLRSSNELIISLTEGRFGTFLNVLIG